MVRDIIQRPGGIDEWGEEHNTKFGLAKYQMTDLSRKRVPHPFLLRRMVPDPRFDLKLGAHTIRSAESVKLLGIHIDRELRWHQQEAAALAKGHAWLIQTARIERPSRGIGARYMRCLYLSVCVPRMLYGADIFLSPPACNRRLGRAKKRERAVVKSLRTIQRRAALAITGALSSTPTDVLDVYANLLPVSRLIEKVRFGAALHLMTLPTSHPLHQAAREETRRPKSHVSPLRDLIADFGLEPGKMEKIQAVRVPATWESSMAVEIPSSKKKAKIAEDKDTAQFKVYTDGSGIDGRIGASTVLFERGTEISSVRLCLGSAEEHTVFEGEGVGGVLAMVLLGEQPELSGPVRVVVDSQPAIRATRASTSTPLHWIWDLLHKCTRALAKLHPEAEITIRWAPGHVDIAGNERADEEAKKAAQHQDSSGLDLIPRVLQRKLPWSKSAVRHLPLMLSSRQWWPVIGRHRLATPARCSTTPNSLKALTSSWQTTYHAV